LDQRRACFDKLSMRAFLRATKVAPHPDLVEGRTAGMQPYNRSAAPRNSLSGLPFRLHRL
jgi:hypothetical protein